MALIAILSVACLVVGLSEGYVTAIVNYTNPCYNTTSPCQNGGTCVIYYRVLYKCICPDNTYGQRCENAATTGTTAIAGMVLPTDCAVQCDLVNKRGPLQCTGATVNASHCLLATQPTAYVVAQRVGTLKMCASYRTAFAGPVQTGWWASSTNHPSCPPYYAKLDTQGCSWRVADGNFWNQWLQVYFGTHIIASGITVQPRFDANEWVKLAKYSYYADINGGSWNTIADKTGMEKIFTVFNTTVYPGQTFKLDVNFDFMIIMSYFKVSVLAYSSFPALRMEVWGCAYATN